MGVFSGEPAVNFRGCVMILQLVTGILKVFDYFMWECILPKTNGEFSPEDEWLEDEFSFWDGLFSGAMVVLGSV